MKDLVKWDTKEKGEAIDKIYRDTNLTDNMEAKTRNTPGQLL